MRLVALQTASSYAAACLRSEAMRAMPSPSARTRRMAAAVESLRIWPRTWERSLVKANSPLRKLVRPCVEQGGRHRLRPEQVFLAQGGQRQWRKRDHARLDARGGEDVEVLAQHRLADDPD